MTCVLTAPPEAAPGTHSLVRVVAYCGAISEAVANAHIA